MKHTYSKVKGILICDKCGGAEGSFTVDCPGMKLGEATLKAIHGGGLDYGCGKWLVPPAEIAESENRVKNWRRGIQMASEVYEKGMAKKRGEA